MRMTDAILPRHTSPGTIKGSANPAQPLCSFPPCWHQGKYQPTWERTFLRMIPTADRGTFHLERVHFNICSSASLRRPFPCQLFLPPKPNGPRSIWLSTKIPAQPFTALYLLQLTAQGNTSSQVIIKLQNWKLSISMPSLFIFFLLQLMLCIEHQVLHTFILGWSSCSRKNFIFLFGV